MHISLGDVLIINVIETYETRLVLIAKNQMVSL